MIGGFAAIPREDAVSSVALQACLYYNVMLSMVFFCFAVINLRNKRDIIYISSLQQSLVSPVISLWFFSEFFRLYCGYKGNLTEKVPETSAFLLVSIFPQFPCLFYITFLQEHTYPIERITGILMLILATVELIIGMAALKSLIRRQTAQFYREVVQDEH
mmetsp:Transcript_29200/g.58670  ORF Transcript_29200/g.58670 Transcript_29200/m.58670 type:complete len:160 (+) Transcript_29200:98-577(+)